MSGIADALPIIPLEDTDFMPVSTSKYYGITMEKVPASYLLWVADQEFSKHGSVWRQVRQYANARREFLEKEAEEDSGDE